LRHDRCYGARHADDVPSAGKYDFPVVPLWFIGAVPPTGRRRAVIRAVETRLSHIPKRPNGREDAMFGLIKGLWNDESGATAVEYGIMVALIAVVIIAAVGLIGTNLNTKFNFVATEVGK
jgi:pilus assembly protein Flp/PilA